MMRCLLLAALLFCFSVSAQTGTSKHAATVEILERVEPIYPIAARRNEEQGTVMLRMFVTADGLPEKIQVERSSGFSKLDIAAREALSKWRFRLEPHPETAVLTQFLIPIVFRLEDVKANETSAPADLKP